MVSGGTYVQAYNCQAAVDEKTQDTTIKTKLTSFNPRESKPTSLPRSTDTEIPYLSALEARYRKLPQPKSGWPGSYSPLKADAHMQRESKSSNLCLDRLKNSVDLTASPSEDSRKSLQNGIWYALHIIFWNFTGWIGNPKQHKWKHHPCLNTNPVWWSTIQLIIPVKSK